YVYIGDFGNNNGDRRDLRILRVAKADLGPAATTATAQAINFSYPDQTNFTPRTNAHNFDCEAFFFANDSLHLFTKNWVDLQTRYYTVPAAPGTYVAHLRGTFNVNGLVTAADLNPTGTTAALLGYNATNGTTFMWLLSGYQGAGYLRANKRRIELPNALLIGQAEGLCFVKNARVFISNEQISNALLTVPPRLYALGLGAWPATARYAGAGSTGRAAGGRPARARPRPDAGRNRAVCTQAAIGARCGIAKNNGALAGRAAHNGPVRWVLVFFAQPLSFTAVSGSTHFSIFPKMALTSDVQQRIDSWLTPAYDADTQAEIKQLQADGQDDALTDAFYRSLEFGTGGLRGIMGAGSNRMNRYTLGMATQGAIAHDSRNNSRLFAETVANIFSGNGITAYLFDALRPTPELSFAIRHLGCQSGCVITASHNPKEYNGFKVYWNDGSQVIAPHDQNIIVEVNKITSPTEVKFEGDPSRIHLIGKELDDAYLTELKTLSINPAAIQRQHDLGIVYTPIHGSGVQLVPPGLAAFGFTNVSVVQAQATPDGNFPTVQSPNPEEKSAMQLALDQAKAQNADIVLATDPDADRVGVGV
nr:phosphoglucomutase 2 [Tanacetum cinerariifolium]